ncbi:1804_t:CDS:2 [Acaulospora colombiana]|uniref:1804_t:CDS:1 n=1 Tax=Acaulospora colombiana TaxID=27376 RepID=A0ACA9MK88_9GLOM|nr:1804_t:CDS:2 [Acaulospora colombiana]
MTREIKTDEALEDQGIHNRQLVVHLSCFNKPLTKVLGSIRPLRQEDWTRHTGACNNEGEEKEHVRIVVYPMNRVFVIRNGAKAVLVESFSANLSGWEKAKIPTRAKIALFTLRFWPRPLPSENNTSKQHLRRTEPQRTTMSYQDSILSRFDSLKEQAKDAIWALAGCACKPAATVKVNGRKYKIVRALGEGGFSFVYLAQDETTGREFALKKIRVHNSEGVKGAMREIEAYRRFKLVSYSIRRKRNVADLP